MVETMYKRLYMEKVGALSNVQGEQVVLARSGSKIGPNLNRTEPDARFRFKVQQIAEPELEVRFSVREGVGAFERRTRK